MIVDAVTPSRPDRHVTTPKMSGICLGISFLEYLAYSTKVGTHHERPPKTNEANVKPNVIHINVRLFKLLIDDFNKIIKKRESDPLNMNKDNVLFKQVNNVTPKTRVGLFNHGTFGATTFWLMNYQYE